MKTYIFILLIPFLLCFGDKAVSQVEPEEEVIITKPTEDSADIGTFYDELSKDGEWIKVENEDIDNDESLQLSETVDIDEDVIGGYIWRPSISISLVDWSPYTYGHWEFTRFGWVWISDYNWGWAPYHYGRWWFSHRWGWVWSPGHRWAPSWVSWCHTRHHIGWHPISPRTHWRHHKGVIITHPITPKQKSITNKWTFVKKEDINKQITNETVINLKNNKELVSDAKITTNGNEVYNTGPKIKEIEKTTGTKITPKKVSVVNLKNESTRNNNSPKTKTLNENGNKTKKKSEEVYRNTESNNTKVEQKNNNTKTKTKQENSTRNPNSNNETKNRNTNKESNKNSNTKKESNRNTNTNRESNKNTNTNRESNKNTNTNRESNKNSNTKQETYNPPTYNPGNSNKNTNTNRESSKPPTYNPGNSNRTGNNNNSSKPNNSPSHNSGNSNKNSSPPPKKSNS
jgi:hypothetical protein